MKCAVLIPVHKATLDPDEERNVRHSLGHLTSQSCSVWWLAPENIDRRYYTRTFPEVLWSSHPDSFFQSISDYSRLLLSNDFYKKYFDCEFLLILQPDAVVLRPNLNYWLAQPYDYIGAPWPRGWEYPLPIRLGSQLEVIPCRAFTGNGGLSLRKPGKVFNLLNEFPEARAAWSANGNPEDLLISMLATLSSDFLVPSIGVASQFAVELDFDFFWKLHGTLPFGVHERRLCNRVFNMISTKI